MTNVCFKCCRPLIHIPTRFICLLVTFLQAGVIDYYLVANLNIYYALFVIADVIVAALFIASFIVYYRYLKHKQKDFEERRETEAFPISYIAWLVYSVSLSAKAGIAFKRFSFLLDENNFFGPNTLKTALALGGVVFLLLLTTLHDAKPGTNRRKYIDELTGTVVFDILDCVDSMEVLFIKEDREMFPVGLDDAIITIACINFILPIVPLVTLSKTNYGHDKLSHRLILFHKLILAFIVNLPLLIIRMILWHGLNHGVSIFSLKNVIIIGMICYDLYEHAEEQNIKQTRTTKNGNNGNDMKDEDLYALEDRYSY